MHARSSLPIVLSRVRSRPGRAALPVSILSATTLLVGCALPSGDTPRPGTPVRDAATDTSPESATQTTESFDAGDAGGDSRDDSRHDPGDGRSNSAIDANDDPSSRLDGGTTTDASLLDGPPIDAAPEAAPCDLTKEPKDQPCLVSDAYAVFVSPGGLATASGTRANPVSTVGQGVAIAAMQGKARVLACTGRYAESVVLDAAHDGISLYGGFDGTSWTWSAGVATTIAAPSSLYALSVRSTTRPITIADLFFITPDAVGQDLTGAGRSSIAAFVSSASSLHLVRVALRAGKGADGAAGAGGVSTPNYPLSEVTAPGGVGADPFASTAATIGGAGGSHQCLLFGLSAGGTGGALTTTATTLPGSAGTSTPAAPLLSPLDGAGGQPEDASMSCTPNGAGHAGANGAANFSGGAASSFGALTPTGWQPSAGGDGHAGTPGQGGGGSSGDGVPFNDGSGGGAGGCGGAGGKAGSGGGASIALLSVDADVVLASCTLAASDAGSGGTGGAGQDGQAGGPAGSSSYAPLCPGGAGGNGAGGSGGAGGSAGVSVAMAYRGLLPNYDAATTGSFGAFGRPGASGAPGVRGGGPALPGQDGHPGALGHPGVSTLVLAL